jgi:hypothetical protein
LLDIAQIMDEQNAKKAALSLFGVCIITAESPEYHLPNVEYLQNKILVLLHSGVD